MKRSAFVELLSMGTAVREYLPALYWLSSAQRVRLARKDKRAGAVDAFLRERGNALSSCWTAFTWMPEEVRKALEVLRPEALEVRCKNR